MKNTTATFFGVTSTRNHIGSSHLKLVCQNSSSPYKQQTVRLFEVLKIPTESLTISAMEPIAIKIESQDSLFLKKICFIHVDVSNSEYFS